MEKEKKRTINISNLQSGMINGERMDCKGIHFLWVFRVRIMINGGYYYWYGWSRESSSYRWEQENKETYYVLKLECVYPQI